MRINKGFTLIEILITLTIIALVVAVGAPKLMKSFGSSMKTTTRNIVMLTKQLHNSAKLKNKTYRIAIKFEDKEGQGRDQFYVESASGGQLVSMDQDEKYKSKKEKDKEESPFSPDTSMMKKPMELPKGLKFSSVEIEGFDQPITEGVAYIHFFPQGLIQKSIIHISDGAQKEISLIIHPLTGRMDIEDSNIRLKDLEQ